MGKRRGDEEMSTTSEWLKVGTVGRPKGLLGAFYVSGRDELLASDLKTVRLNGDVGTFRSIRHHNGRSFVEISQLTDRNQVIAANGASLWVLRREIGVDNRSEFLWADLIGADVIDVSGTALGRLSRIYNVGASDVMEIVADHGVWECPLTREFVDWGAGNQPLRLLVERSQLDVFYQKS